MAVILAWRFKINGGLIGRSEVSPHQLMAQLIPSYALNLQMSERTPCVRCLDLPAQSFRLLLYYSTVASERSAESSLLALGLLLRHMKGYKAPRLPSYCWVQLHPSSFTDPARNSIFSRRGVNVKMSSCDGGLQFRPYCRFPSEMQLLHCSLTL